MRIGFDATPAADRRTPGGHGTRGIGRFTDLLAGALLSVSPDWAARHVRFLVAAGQDLPLPAGMPRSWVTARPGPLPWHLGWLTAALRDRSAVRGAPPALWHLIDPQRPFAPLPAARTIATVHDLIPLQDRALLDGMRPHQRWVYRHYLDRVRGARLVITHPTVAADVTRLLGVPPGRVRSLTPWVRPRGGPLGPTPTEPDGFLLVGVNGPHKRFELAVEAVARMGGSEARRWPLRVCGTQPPGALARLRALAAERGVALEVLGHVPSARLAELYRGSVLLATSSIEGFGFTPVEAVLAGGRVAAVPIPAYRHSVGDVACFADDDSPGALADAAERAIATPVAPADRERLAATFSAEACARSLIEAYELAMVGGA